MTDSYSPVTPVDTAVGSLSLHRPHKAAALLLIITAVFFALNSCTTLSDMAEKTADNYGKPSVTNSAADRRGDSVGTVFREDRELVITDGYVQPTDIQQRIVDSGLKLQETRDLEVRGQQFNADCTGTVLAAYWGAGLNPAKFFGKYTGGGVRRLYEMGADYDLVYLDRIPDPGDVIIWDNTWDADENGKWGDPYTHAGIVISVREDGEITYLHYNYAKGVVLEKMNLNQPDVYTDDDGRLVNSPMRMKSDRYIKPDSWLSGQLIRGFISLYEYPGIGED